MENKETRRKRILNNSFKEMYLKGYNGCSVNDLVQAANLPKGSFYNYFASKKQYAIYAIEYYGDLNQKDFNLLLDKTALPLDRIKNFFLAKISKSKDMGLEYGCFVGNLSEELGGIEPEIAAVATKFHQNIENKIVENLQEAKIANYLIEDIDENVLASVIVNMWQGTLLRVKVSHNADYFLDFYEVLEKKLLK